MDGPPALAEVIADSMEPLEEEEQPPSEPDAEEPEEEEEEEEEEEVATAVLAPPMARPLMNRRCSIVNFGGVSPL